MAAAAQVQHYFHRLPVDTLERMKMCHQIADKRMQLAPHYLEHEFGNRVVKYPQYDIKLNSNGPDMEIKLLRAKEVPGYTHQEVGDAAWNSIFNFQFDVPDRFKPHVKCDVSSIVVVWSCVAVNNANVLINTAVVLAPDGTGREHAVWTHDRAAAQERGQPGDLPALVLCRAPQNHGRVHDDRMGGDHGGRPALVRALGLDAPQRRSWMVRALFNIVDIAY